MYLCAEEERLMKGMGECLQEGRKVLTGRKEWWENKCIKTAIREAGKKNEENGMRQREKEPPSWKESQKSRLRALRHAQTECREREKKARHILCLPETRIIFPGGSEASKSVPLHKEKSERKFPAKFGICKFAIQFVPSHARTHSLSLSLSLRYP